MVVLPGSGRKCAASATLPSGPSMRRPHRVKPLVGFFSFLDRMIRDFGCQRAQSRPRSTRRVSGRSEAESLDGTR
jgi:hypothetical protein